MRMIFLALSSFLGALQGCEYFAASTSGITEEAAKGAAAERDGAFALATRAEEAAAAGDPATREDDTVQGARASIISDPAEHEPVVCERPPPRTEAPTLQKFLLSKGALRCSLRRMLLYSENVTFWQALWDRYHDFGGHVASDGTRPPLSRTKSAWPGPPPEWWSTEKAAAAFFIQSHWRKETGKGQIGETLLPIPETPLRFRYGKKLDNNDNNSDDEVDDDDERKSPELQKSTPPKTSTVQILTDASTRFQNARRVEDKSASTSERSVNRSILSKSHGLEDFR